MKIELIGHTSALVVIEAIRTCWNSGDKSDTVKEEAIGPKDAALITNIIKNGHTSTLEHAIYNFRVIGISRAVLQELARHRLASLSVQSTRYCLKRLVDGESKVDEMLAPSGDFAVDSHNKDVLLAIAEMMRINPKITNDKLKYAIPEAFLTRLIWTINARSLRNFFMLRTSNRALAEIRRMAGAVFDAIPASHRIFFEDCIQ